MQTHRVLFLGSSQLRFSESADRPPLPHLTCTLLGESSPAVTWEAETALAYPLPNMAGQVAKAAGLAAPDLVVLFLGTSTVSEYKVEYVLRGRSRAASRLAHRVANLALSLAGGGTEGSPGVRGLLFRLPRALAGRVLGAAPLVSLDVALASVKSSVEALDAGFKGRLLVLLSSGAPQAQSSAGRSRETIRRFNEEVAAWCSTIGVRCVDPVRRVEEAGFEFVRPDGIHAGFDTRKALAGIIADEVLRLVGGGVLPAEAATAGPAAPS